MRVRGKSVRGEPRHCGAAPNTKINISGAHGRDRSAVTDRSAIYTHAICFASESTRNSASSTHSGANNRNGRSARNLTLALGSTIISDFPEIFAEFGGKRFSLLWQGGRNGFGVRDFHDRCDAHANTLTLIEDTDGSIFDRFPPVKLEEWEEDDYDNTYTDDASLTSFLFTLKNPHNVKGQPFGRMRALMHWRNSFKSGRSIFKHRKYRSRWWSFGCRRRK
jgi:hypothetical protein